MLVYRDVEKATGFYAASGFMNRYTLQAGTRLAVKLDFACGLIARALEANGTAELSRRTGAARRADGLGEPHVGADVRARASTRRRVRAGLPIPKLEFAVLVRLFGAMAWPKVEEVVGQALGGSPIVDPLEPPRPRRAQSCAR